MDGLIELSRYFDETDGKESVVLKDPSNVQYYVTIKSAFGTWFTCIFHDLQEAEDYAEDWVLNGK